MRRVALALVSILTLTGWTPLLEHPDGSPYTWDCDQPIRVLASSASREETYIVRWAVRQLAFWSGLPVYYAGTTRTSTVDMENRVVLRGGTWTAPGVDRYSVVVGLEDQPIDGYAGKGEPLGDFSYYRSGYVRVDMSDVAAFSSSDGERLSYLRHLLLHELGHVAGADHHEVRDVGEVMGVSDQPLPGEVTTRYGAEDREALSALGCL